MSRHKNSGSTEHFIIVTLNHKTISLQELPQYGISCEKLGEYLQNLAAKPSIQELVGLTTCNRIEFYATTTSVKDAAHIIARRIAENAGCSFESLMDKFDVHVDGEAVDHLFQLVSGLDSMVVGDAQILGQVKAAFQQAVQLGLVKKSFNSLFQKAFSVAKRVRKETGFGKGRVSVSALAVEHAKTAFGSLHDKVATVVGAGKMGALAAKYLKDSGIKELRIVNRSLDRSLELADKVEAKVYGMDELERILAESDLVISSTAAEEFIITHELVENALSQRKKPLLLIDIALPLDIDPSISDLTGVSLTNLETLRKQAAVNLMGRQEQYERAKEIVECELDRLGPWPMPTHIDSLARQLGEYASQISEEEVSRLFDQLPDLTPRQREIIETQMVRLAERMVLAPRRNLRKRGKASICPDAFNCLKDLFDHDCGARDPLSTKAAESESHV